MTGLIEFHVLGLHCGTITTQCVSSCHLIIIPLFMFILLLHNIIKLLPHGLYKIVCCSHFQHTNTDSVDRQFHDIYFYCLLVSLSYTKCWLCGKYFPKSFAKRVSNLYINFYKFMGRTNCAICLLWKDFVIIMQNYP